LNTLHQQNDQAKFFTYDTYFDSLYPESIQYHSDRHWTPLEMARISADFLAEPGSAILDIGSGIGKFCLAAAWYRPGTQFVGVEQRSHLHRHANRVKKQLGIQNAFFIHGNFTQLDLGDFRHFYFYNSFYENFSSVDRIDYKIDYSIELYTYYTHYLLGQLEKKPAGTRLVTFHSLGEEIPPSFREAGSYFDGTLKCWIKG